MPSVTSQLCLKKTGTLSCFHLVRTSVSTPSQVRPQCCPLGAATRDTAAVELHFHQASQSIRDCPRGLPNEDLVTRVQQNCSQPYAVVGSALRPSHRDPSPWSPVITPKPWTILHAPQATTPTPLLAFSPRNLGPPVSAVHPRFTADPAGDQLIKAQSAPMERAFLRATHPPTAGLLYINTGRQCGIAGGARHRLGIIGMGPFAGMQRRADSQSRRVMPSR